jgi:hypothetical protein
MMTYTPRYWIGADFARKKDYTAVTIMERMGDRRDVSPENPYRVRHCERLPLGTRYLDVQTYLRDLMTDVRRYAQARYDELPPKLRGRDMGSVTLVIDESGLGAPMFDLLDQAQLKPVGITIIGGPTWSTNGLHYTVPLNDLITAVELGMEQQTLGFAADLDHLPTLIEEFATFERRLTKAGHDTYGNYREGSHDDMIFSIALPLWFATYGYADVRSHKLLGV